MAEFLTSMKYSHVIYQFYCKFDADYENLKIFHFWANRAVFWAVFWIFSTIFEKKFFSTWMILSPKKQKKIRKKNFFPYKMVTWSTLSHFRAKIEIYWNVDLFISFGFKSSFKSFKSFKWVRRSIQVQG